MTAGKTSYFDSETLANGVAGGKMGGRSARAKDFFDTILDVQMTAALLKCSVTTLKEAVRYGRQINGKDIPVPAQINDRGHMFFDGREIKTFLYGADSLLAEIPNLSQAQEDAVNKLKSVNDWASAYDLKLSSATLNALKKKGLVISRGDIALGSISMQRTTIQYKIKQAAMTTTSEKDESMSNSMTRYKAFLAQSETDGVTGQPFAEWFALDTDTYASVISDIKALDGRIFAMLTPDEKSLLEFFQNCGRKYGVAISIVNLASREELMKATSKEQADQILSAANSKVSVIHRPQIQDEYYQWDKSVN